MTYMIQPGDTGSKIAHTFAVTLDQLLAANPRLSDFPPPAGQLINLPPNAISPSPTSTPAASTPPRTFPPLPAIAVMANGAFTADEGISEFTVGTTFSLKFRFDGGAVTGSGSRPTYRRDGPTCKFTTRTTLTFSGAYDPLTRHVTGIVEAVDTTVLSYATTDACKSLAGTTRFEYAWSAQVSEDAKGLSGSVTGQGPQDVQPFVATIVPAG